MMDIHDQLQSLFPNVQVKKRLRVSAEYIVQEWGEVYNREKMRLSQKGFVDIKSELESELFRLEQELTAMNALLKNNGYSKELHQRFKVSFLKIFKFCEWREEVLQYLVHTIWKPSLSRKKQLTTLFKVSCETVTHSSILPNQ